MATTLGPNFVKEYNSSLQILTQLKGNKFRGKCVEESINGEEEYFDQLGSVTAASRTGIFQASPENEIVHNRRKVVANAYDVGLYVDKIEKVQTLVDPESKYLAQMNVALNRKRDIEFLSGALGTAATGKAGAGTAPLTDCPLVAANDEGMTLDKLINALYELEKSGVDVEDPMTKPYFVWGPRQKNELLTNTKATSSDFDSVRKLATGQINSFYGFEFVSTNLLPFVNTAGTGVNLDWDETEGGQDAPVDTDSTAVRMCFAYTRDNIIQATNPEITTEAEKRGDKRFDWYAYALIRTGAVRMQETNLVTVPCAESTDGIATP